MWTWYHQNACWYIGRFINSHKTNDDFKANACLQMDSKLPAKTSLFNNMKTVLWIESLFIRLLKQLRINSHCNNNCSPVITMWNSGCIFSRHTHIASAAIFIKYWAVHLLNHVSCIWLDALFNWELSGLYQKSIE